MSNWIPKITYTELGTGTAKTITFDSPPESDPFNEQIIGINKKNQSSNGTSQVQWSYNKQALEVGFKFQTETTKEAFQDLLENHAYQGGVFTYQPHSDVDTDKQTYELLDKKVSFERPIPDASGDFEYNFGFKMERVLDFTYEVEETGVGAINETQFTIVNNQTTWADITGLSFNPTLLRGARIYYTINRKHTTPNSQITEFGRILISYNDTDTAWDISRESNNDAGIEMMITTAGQFQYKSSNISGSVDVSALRFEASTISVED
jgi:hypothetical protein